MYNENSIINIFNSLKVNYQNLNFELTKLILDASNGISQRHYINIPINEVTFDIFSDISNAKYNNTDFIFTNNSDDYDSSYNHYLGYLTDTEIAVQDISNNIKTLNNLYNILYLSFSERSIN